MIPSSGRGRAPQATELFNELRASGKSSEDIFITLYADLKQLARMKIARQPPGASMHATRLLSDLYLRLFGKRSSTFEWDSAAHFFNTMALAMEQLLIDHARQFVRRGRTRTDSLEGLVEDGFQVAAEAAGDAARKPLSQDNIEQAIFIKELLDRLETENVDEGKARQARRQAEIVRLRIFVGLTEDEAAEVLGCSSETVTKEFRKAKARLASYIRRGTTTADTETAPDRRTESC